MKALNYEINFYKIKNNWFERNDLAFENLCKEFLEQKFWCTEHFQLDNNYQALEASPIKDREWNFISFQAKLVKGNVFWSIKKSFFDKWKICKIKSEDLKIIDIIYIFSAEKINDTDQKTLSQLLNDIKPDIKIIFYTWEKFKEELKLEEFYNLRQKYFYNRQLEKEFHENNYRKNYEETKIKPLRDIKWMTNEKDKKDVNDIYTAYQGNKLCYAWTDSFDVITDIEDEVLKLKWKTFERWTDRQNLDFFHFIEWTRNEVEKINDILWDRICFLLSEDEFKRWIVIQHHADSKAAISIEWDKCIYKVKKSPWM